MRKALEVILLIECTKGFEPDAKAVVRALQGSAELIADDIADDMQDGMLDLDFDVTLRVAALRDVFLP